MMTGPRPGQLGEVDPAVVARVLEAAGQRVTEINRTTRDGLAEVISQGIDQGMGAAELGRAIESWSGWDEYRAEMIARTETGMAFNETALATYRDGGIEQVQVTDGDDDEICAPWANWTGPIDEAPEPLGHPNCTRDIIPVVTYTAEDIAAAQGLMAPEPMAPVALPEPVVPEPIAAAVPVQPSLADIIAPDPPKPVADAFTEIIAKVRSEPLAMMNKSYVKVTDGIESALKTIGDVFHDGNLPRMPSIGPLIGGRTSVLGMYKHGSFGLRLPQSLEFRPNAYRETIFHEITHFLDQHGFGYEGQFASRLGWAKEMGRLDQLTASARQALSISSGDAAAIEAKVTAMEARAELMAPVARAIMDSPEWRAMGTAMKDLTIDYPMEDALRPGFAAIKAMHVDRSMFKWLVYATSPEESFARAMAQYLVRREGGVAMTQLEERIYAMSQLKKGAFLLDSVGNRIAAPLADQWSWEHFEPIDRAITDMLRTLHWLV